MAVNFANSSIVEHPITVYTGPAAMACGREEATEATTLVRPTSKINNLRISELK